MRCSLTLSFGGEINAHNGSALHDEFEGFEDARVGERVAAEGDEIGVVAGFERANLVSQAKEISSIDGGGLDGVERLHAPFDHLAKLSRVVAVWVDAGIRAERHLRAGLKGVAEIFTLQAADFLLFFDGLGEHSCFRAFLQNVVVVVNVEDEIGAMLLGKGDAFVVDQAGMFDGVDAGADSVLDRLRTVRVGGDLASELVGFFRDGLHFFERVLRRAGLIAFAEHTAGGADLDDVGAVLDGFANFGAGGPGTVGDAFRLIMIFGRQQIIVAMAASDAKRRAGSAHSRTFDIAGVDGIPEGDVRVTARAHVSNRGEAGAQRKPRVLHPGNGFAWNRNSEAGVATGCGIAREMRVHVDKSWQTRGVRKIHRHNAAGEFRGRKGADGGDRSAIVEHNGLVGQNFAGTNVEQFPAANGSRRSVSDGGQDEYANESG